MLTLGGTSARLYAPDVETKIPETLFYDTRQNVSSMEAMLQDFLVGEHLLLVGNQGVGKNKLIDRLLSLLRRPREYIQLHRDTTVQVSSQHLVLGPKKRIICIQILTTTIFGTCPSKIRPICSTSFFASSFPVPDPCADRPRRHHHLRGLSAGQSRQGRTRPGGGRGRQGAHPSEKVNVTKLFEQMRI